LDAALALVIGFSVKELGAIFGERDRGGAPNHRVRMMAAERLVALEARLRELQSWRHELRRTLARWERLPQDPSRQALRHATARATSLFDFVDV